MRRNDFTAEFGALASLLDLKPGEVALDAQCEPDALISVLHYWVTNGGRTVGRVIGLAFGQAQITAVQKKIADESLDRAEVMPLHPSNLRGTGRLPGLKSDMCAAAVLRHDLGIVNLGPALGEMYRVCKPGARIVARHVDWTTHLPKATDREQEMLDSLVAPDCAEGTEFFARFQAAPLQPWRDVRFDVFTLATRDDRTKTRFRYDWRRLLSEQLHRSRTYSPGEIKNLIDRLDQTRGAKVIADRYVALGIKR